MSRVPTRSRNAVGCPHDRGPGALRWHAGHERDGVVSSPRLRAQRKVVEELLRPVEVDRRRAEQRRCPLSCVVSAGERVPVASRRADRGILASLHISGGGTLFPLSGRGGLQRPADGARDRTPTRARRLDRS